MATESSCGMTCVKYLVFLFNFLFALTGLLVLIAGAVIQNTYHHYSNFIGESFWTAPIVLMVIGSLIFVVSFFGCCGALKESSCMILTFSVFLVIVFLVEIGIGIAGYLKHDELPGILESGFNKTLEDYTSSIEAQHAWALVQGELKCCGIKGASDWKPIFINNTVPASCCSQLPVHINQCSSEFASKMGCMPKLFNLLDSKSLLLGGVGIGIALIQLVGVFFACCLSRAFRENYETV